MQWIKQMALVCLLVGAAGRYTIAAESDGQSPVRAFEVTMAKTAHGLVLDQLRKFADANAFSFKMRQTSPNPERILVQMRSGDMRIIGLNVTDRGATDITYAIFLYWEGDDAIPAQAFDGAVVQLRKMLNDTDGVISVTADE